MQPGSQVIQDLARVKHVNRSDKPYGTISRPPAGHNDEASRKDALGKSPLRQSLQNIVAAVKKKARAISWRLDAPRATLSAHSPGENRRERTEPCPPTPPPKPISHSGRLLHLSTTSSGHTLNQSWRPYLANLTLDGIVLEPTSPSEMTNTFLVSLARCVDVRATRFNHELLENSSLQPVRSEDIRAFELVFEGQPSQYFACFTSQERAVWIDSIWESILSLHDMVKGTRPRLPLELDDFECTRPFLNRPIGLPITQSPRNTYQSDLRPASQASVIDTGRLLLPPLAIASGCPSLTSSSCTTASSINPQPGPRSPSIVNLGALSVVKQRISQLEGGHPGFGAEHVPVTPQTPSSVGGKELDAAALSPVNVYGDGNLLDYYSGDDTQGETRNPSPPSHLKSTDNRKSLPPELSGVASGDIEIASAGAARVLSPLGRLPSPHPYPQITPRAMDVCLEDRFEQTGEKLESLLKRYLGQAPAYSPDTTINSILTSICDLSSSLENRQHGFATKLDIIIANTQRLPSDQSTISLPGLKPIHGKLDALLAAQHSNTNGKDSTLTEPSQDPDIQQLIALLKADLSDRAAQYQQQVDSVRYLSELNTWLETFVSNGTSQIQGLAANVEQLCQVLGCDPGATHGGSGGLRQEIQQILAEGRSREHNMNALHNNIASLVHEQRQGVVTSPTEMIGGIMARQRHEHETMLATFVQEITREIRGERLRFVEAMKEATAINVQMHVDQFKQELNKEVIGMTKEVQRLHDEKKAVEGQIAELFSFYSTRASIPRPQ